MGFQLLFSNVVLDLRETAANIYLVCLAGTGLGDCGVGDNQPLSISPCQGLQGHYVKLRAMTADSFDFPAKGVSTVAGTAGDWFGTRS